MFIMMQMREVRNTPKKKKVGEKKKNKKSQLKLTNTHVHE